MSRHFRYGPSSRYRWAQCPGVLRLTDAINPPEEVSEYAAAGIVAHAEAAECLQNEKDCGDPAVQAYIEYVRSLPGVKMVEHTLEHPAIPGFGGTPDALVVDWGRALHVIDLKTGAGVGVSPDDSPQLQAYAVLAADVLMDDFVEVHLTIVQPNYDGEAIKTQVVSAGDIAVWREAIVTEIAACEQPDAPFHSGRHCQFCKVRAHCPELRGHIALAAGLKATSPVEQLPLAQIDWILQHRRQIVQYVDAVEAYAMSLALAGDLPGWKAVSTLKNRAWINPDKTLKAMKKLGLKLDVAAPRELISPAQADKLLDRKLVEALVKREPGPPKLVKDDAPGEAINVLAVFDEVKGDESVSS